MFNDFLKRNKEYKEAYLKIDDNDKVVEKVKTKREELGQISKEEHDMISGAVDSNNDDSDIGRIQVDEEPSIQSGNPDKEDDSMERPAKKLNSSLILSFWTLLFIGTAIYYIPTMINILDTPVDYNDIQLTFTKKGVKEDVPLDGGGKDSPGDMKTDEHTSENIEVPTGQGRPIGGKVNEITGIENGNTIQSIELPNREDAATIYSGVHADIINHSDVLRESVQGYIVNTNSHINMASTGTRIQVSLNGLRFKMGNIEDDELKDVLLNRIERLSLFTKQMSSFDKDSAETIFNEFIESENADSKEFIVLFTTYLENEEREYRIENDIIYYN